MIQRSLLMACMLTGLVSACSPEALLGTVAGPQLEAIVYERLQTELSGQGMAKAQVDCIVAGVKAKLTPQDILAGSTPAGMDKIKQLTVEVTTACVAGQQPTEQPDPTN